ncbi:hypothetical protein [Desulfopila sp. IMCC35008]|uniref:hypothetical protein n=1 Tax=Desulfopila sp. IMCC35008 TaxID=2653858 RepID=UPI0013D4C6CC|nr:hypothetical protein [Desulfopila sp. IMCC35008]
MDNKTNFIETGRFTLSKEEFMALTEKERIEFYLAATQILQCMEMVEEITAWKRNNITDKQSESLASAALTIAEALNSGEKADIRNLSESEIIEGKELVNEVLDSEHYSEFKRWRTIGIDKGYLSETYEKSLEVNSYNERGIVYDQLMEIYKDISSGNGLNSQDHQDIRRRKAEFADHNNAQMAAYVEYMRSSKHTMSGVE